MVKELTVYKGSINEDDDDDLEVSCIALVDYPAIESNFLAFSKKKLSYAIDSEEQRMITGLVMMADTPLYRDQDGEKFYVTYDAASIKAIALKFFRKKYNFNFNESHDPNLKTDDIYIFESWFVDREAGKMPMPHFADAPNGSWAISAKIDNDKIWQDIKTGKFKGFSVEGFFRLEDTKTTEVNPLTKEENEAFDIALIELLQSSRA